MDNLEKFIRENRPAFDTEVPDLRVWANINRKMDTKPKLRIVWVRHLRAVAAAAVLAAVACAIGFKMGSDSKEARSLADISPEHAELETYYNNQIDEKLAKLADYRQDGFVTADFQELDAMYEELKRELEKAPVGSEEQVIQAMIGHYQTKLDILEKVLEKVQSTGQTNSKTEENEISI